MFWNATIINFSFKTTYYFLLLQADKERAERQREFLAQLEREAAGFDESSEPTSMTNSSTVEGEHTIQGNDEDEDTLENIDYDSDNEDILLEDLEWDSFDTKNTKK